MKSNKSNLRWTLLLVGAVILVGDLGLMTAQASPASPNVPPQLLQPLP